MSKKEILTREGIFLGLKSVSKEDAIKAAGEKLFKLGYVKKDYVNYMLEREKISTTYIGNYVAIPHGTGKSKHEVITPGVVVLQYPDGIEFGDQNIAYFLIGIAGKNDEHIEIISNLADVIEEEERVKYLSGLNDVEKLYEAFSI